MTDVYVTILYKEREGNVKLMKVLNWLTISESLMLCHLLNDEPMRQILQYKHKGILLYSFTWGSIEEQYTHTKTRYILSTSLAIQIVRYENYF